MRFAVGIFLLPLLALWAAPPVPYYGKVSIDGINYHGAANFSFSLLDANGTEHWRNGVDANESIRVFVVNGRYSVMLGGQGMDPLPPELFLQHENLYLRVKFGKGDGTGLRHLGPDQLITTTPRALVAEVAKVAEVAEVAKVAEKLSGAITSDMLSPEVLSKLDANQSAAPMGPITRDMLPADVLADLNKSAPAVGPITLSMLAPEVTAKLEGNASGGISGPITRDMLPADVLADLNKSAPAVGPITLSMLDAEVTAKLESNASGGISGPITREMLPADVLADLNKTITRDMLPSDVLADLNKSVTITREMLPADVLADLNKSAPAVGPITLSMLDAEVTAKLDSNTSGTTTVNNPPAVGSLIAIPYGESAPAGYTLYQQGTPKNELVWEEKVPVSEARKTFDGVAVLDDKIYFAGGSDGQGKDIAERYDPINNNWETLTSMSVARKGMASAALNGNFYAIAGQGSNSVEVYDLSSQSWSSGVPLPSETHFARAIALGGKIYLIGGKNSSDQNINQVICFDPSSNQWSSKASMPTARDGMWLQRYNDRIWAIGGHSGGDTDVVESYDPISDTWRTETSLSTKRNWAVGWVDKGKIFVGGGNDGSSSFLYSIEAYDSSTKQWAIVGNLPEKTYNAGAVVLNDKVYVIAGATTPSVYSNKVYAADLNASVAGVYDLYRKDGNASAGTPVVQAEVADGSVTASKLANNTITTSQLNEQILKYLKPEITAQPQGKIVYADNNVSFSVTAEGKFLSYQWKKDGSDLTGETNATLNIIDANATLHDGNYSVVVSNDFGSVESGVVEINAIDALMNGLVGWWKFDETNGTIAYDSSGYGNDGNLTGGPTWATGKIGGALNFDGVDDYVVTDVTTGLDFSISTWVKTSDNDAHIMGLNGGASWIFWIDEGELRFELQNGSWNEPTRFAVSSDWTYLTGVFESLDSSARVYKNGSFQSTKVVLNRVVNDSIISIGKWLTSTNNNVPRPFNGLIDDVRIYDRALSASEVQALYNMGQ